MAEKRDSKKTPKPKAAGKPAGKTKDTGTSHEKSGEVKGPMGVGGRKKPSARATVKNHRKLLTRANIFRKMHLKIPQLIPRRTARFLL